MWQLEEVIRAVRGTPWRVARDRFAGVSTDSRTIREGELFVPLKGPRFDGHEFIEEVFAKGASGTLCDRGREKGLSEAAGTVIVPEEARLHPHRHRGLPVLRQPPGRPA